MLPHASHTLLLNVDACHGEIASNLHRAAADRYHVPHLSKKKCMNTKTCANTNTSGCLHRAPDRYKVPHMLGWSQSGSQRWTRACGL